MGESKNIFGRNPAGNIWVPIQCDAAGHLVIQLDTLTNPAGDTAGLSAAGIFSISAQSRMRVYRNAVQGIVTNVWTTVQFDVTEYDEQAEWDGVTFRWIADEEGYYHFACSAEWQNLGAGVRHQIRIRRNGVVRCAKDEQTVNAAWGRNHICMQDHAAIGDWFEVQVWQNQGINKSIMPAASDTWFAVHKLS